MNLKVIPDTSLDSTTKCTLDFKSKEVKVNTI